MQTRKIALLGAMVAASLAGQAAQAIHEIPGNELNLIGRRRRRWAKLDDPHNYPPNPFESRQVRRARERLERKQQTLTK
jgi:hypothetical protein